MKPAIVDDDINSLAPLEDVEIKTEVKDEVMHDANDNAASATASAGEFVFRVSGRLPKKGTLHPRVCPPSSSL